MLVENELDVKSVQREVIETLISTRSVRLDLPESDSPRIMMFSLRPRDAANGGNIVKVEQDGQYSLTVSIHWPERSTDVSLAGAATVCGRSPA